MINSVFTESHGATSILEEVAVTSTYVVAGVISTGFNRWNSLPPFGFVVVLIFVFQRYVSIILVNNNYHLPIIGYWLSFLPISVPYIRR